MPMQGPVYSHIRIVLLLIATLVAPGCKKRPSAQAAMGVAVTNTYLQCAVADVTGDASDVLCLAPPGMCPGHFDLSPGQVQQLTECRLLMRADFQHRIEDSLIRMKEKGLKVVSIHIADGMCIPANYLQSCREVHRALQERYSSSSDDVYKERFLSLQKRLGKLSGHIESSVDDAGLRGTRVVCSGHQAEFARWLGLDVVAAFVGSDVETAANLQDVLEKAREKNVGFVIANRQEGSALAEALAERLNARVVVFSNFPDVQPGRNNFDTLVMENLNALLEAGRR